jgi:uncharacterized membrane protein (DUF4010 family)
MTSTFQDLAGLIVAALGGAAVGVEREWSGHASGPAARFAGVRTFTLLGLMAGVAGWVWRAGAVALATALVAGGAALVVAAYVAASRKQVDGTTEVAALVVIAAGTLAGSGRLAVASAIVAATALLLVEKSRLHALVQRVDDASLRAGFRFAVMAVVILPLLPEGPYGPLGGVRPRDLWMWVLFFSGLSFVGYLARRAFGARAGYAVTGLAGGLVSSTNVTFTFAGASRTHPALGPALAAGVLAANTMLFVRVLVAVSALNAALVPRLVPYLAPPFFVGLVASVGGWWRQREVGPEIGMADNPLQFKAALQMTLLFQIVLFAVSVVDRVWGDLGVVVSGAVLGLTDVDALTISMARTSGRELDLGVAARAIALGIVSNTMLKTFIAVVAGRGRFRWAAGAGLAAILVAGVAALVVAS